MELWTDPLPKDPKAPHISQLLAESPTEQILKKIAGFDLATASRDLNFQKKWLSKPKSYHILEEWTSLNSPKFIPSKLPESVRHFRDPRNGSLERGAEECLGVLAQGWTKIWLFCQEKWCDNGRLMGYWERTDQLWFWNTGVWFHKRWFQEGHWCFKPSNLGQYV